MYLNPWYRIGASLLFYFWDFFFLIYILIFLLFLSGMYISFLRICERGDLRVNADVVVSFTFFFFFFGFFLFLCRMIYIYIFFSSAVQLQHSYLKHGWVRRVYVCGSILCAHTRVIINMNWFLYICEMQFFAKWIENREMCMKYSVHAEDWVLLCKELGTKCPKLTF